VHHACTGCAVGSSKAEDGSCQACAAGATSDGGFNSKCNCAGLGDAYVANGDYTTAEGCPCATGYAKNDTDTTCTNCADDHFWNEDTQACEECIGGGDSTSGFKNTCTCSSAPAADGFDSSDPDAYTIAQGCPCAEDFYKDDDHSCKPCQSGGSNSEGFADTCVCAADGNFDGAGYDTTNGCGAPPFATITPSLLR
jgi:hypothetical protein